MKTQTIRPVLTQFAGKSVFVRSLIVKGQQLWAATEQGLYIYDLLTKSIDHYQYNPYDAHSLSDNPLYCLYCDGSNNVWLGSYFGGVNFVAGRPSVFQHFYPANANRPGLSGRRVREMVQDRLGQIWVGTEDNGLNCMNPQTGTFQWIKESAEFPNIHGLCLDGDLLWVGTFSYGIKLIDISSHRIVKNYSADGKPGSLLDNTIFSICRSPRGELYFASIRGLYTFDRRAQQFRLVKAVPMVLINDVRFDRQGNLWLATQNYGIYVRFAHAQKWVHIQNSADGTKLDRMINIFEDSEGRIWFTQQSKELFCYNFSTQKVDKVKLDRLTYQSQLEIVEDRHGYFWISSNAGIVKYDPRTQRIRLFSSKEYPDDVDQFNYSSSLIDPQGRIYFGSLNGIVRFSPDNLEESQPAPRLVASDLFINDRAVDCHSEDSPLDSSLVVTHKLSLSHRQNIFSLRVEPLNYTTQRPLTEYKLEGFDKEWKMVRVDNVIAFSQVPAGHYRLRVRVEDADGKWSPKEYRLAIVVSPHPLLSVWAKIIYAILMAWVLWLLLRFYIRRNTMKRERAMEEFQHQKEQELYNSKISFFTNVAHEIRTPLTLIKGPLEHIIHKGNIKDQALREELSIMDQNANRLTDLINQLLDFRKAEKDGLQLNFERHDIKRIVRETYTRFTSLMDERKISHSLLLPEGELYADVDKEAFTKVLSNLFNNAVKYCEGQMNVSLGKEDTNFVVTVCNDGPLIPETQREQIFEPFFRSESEATASTTGTGIGLALARSLSELHHGQLHVVPDAKLNVFRLTLPLIQDQKIELDKAEQPKPQDEEVIVEEGKDTLLLVDDNQQMLDYEKTSLQTDYNILTATDGEQALGVLSRNDIALIVTDIMMEPMDGLELCKHVKQDVNMSHIPVILLTAVTMEGAKLQGAENGADAYIEKPFSMEFLQETIQSLIRARNDIRRAYTNSPFVPLDSVSISKADAEFMRQLSDLVKRNMGNSMYNLNQLAADMNMSRTSLNRKIRGTLKMSPSSYIKVERLKKAAMLLKQGDAKVAEVCYEVGFSSPSYFTKCFQEQFGLLPTDFIKSATEK